MRARMHGRGSVLEFQVGFEAPQPDRQVMEHVPHVSELLIHAWLGWRGLLHSPVA